jgi:type IV secretory pathway TraG/TraD family ATPase VirD4
MIKVVNRQNQLKSSVVFDEFPTIYFNNMDSLIATARSNKVATKLAVQDFSQLKKDYGAEQADFISYSYFRYLKINRIIIKYNRNQWKPNWFPHY